jgi:hypothetical protein
VLIGREAIAALVRTLKAGIDRSQATSVFGTSLHFAASRNSVGYRAIADIGQVVSQQVYGSRPESEETVVASSFAAWRTWSVPIPFSLPKYRAGPVNYLGTSRDDKLRSAATLRGYVAFG